MKLNECKLLLIPAILLLAAGLYTGQIIGKNSIKGGPSGIGPVLVLFHPAGNYIDSVKLLNSGNPFKRLSGYYAYSQTGLIDFDYLYSRYMEEDLTVIKNTIIWAASQSSSSDDVIKFYSKIYNSANKRNRNLILNYIEKNDKEKYNDFIEKK
jgi:hypothetical protein